MKKISVILFGLIFLGGLWSCTTLSSLSETEFADAISNIINSTNSGLDDEDRTPEIMIISPTNNQVMDEAFEVSGSIFGVTNITHVFVFVQPTDGGTTETYATLLSGSGLILFSTYVSNLTRPYYYIWAQIFDELGNVVNTPKITVAVSGGFVDEDPPLVQIASPADGSTAISGNITVAGTASDASALQAVYVKIGSTTKTITSSMNNWSTVFSLAAGSYDIIAWAADVYDNTGGYTTNHITVTNAVGSNPAIAVYYSGTLISGTAYTNDFGTTVTNSSVGPRQFKISNTGTATLTISNVTDTSSQFNTSTLNGANILPGETVTFDVTYSPTSAGTHVSSINIANNSTNKSTFIFYVKGIATNGVSPGSPEIAVYYGSTLITSGTSYTNDFGTTLTNQNVGPRTFTVSNLGTASLTVSSVHDNSSAYFSTVNLSTSISAGSAATFDVTYTPTSAGTHITKITIVNDDSDENPSEFYVKGVATNAFGGQITITVDGTRETAWNNAFEENGSDTLAPLDVTNFMVANDSSYLYIGITADNSISDWNRNILILYKKNNTDSAGTPAIDESHFGNGDTWDSTWKPTGALYFKVGKDETWKGTFAKQVNTGGSGWDIIITGNTNNHAISADYKFMEGKFDIASLGLSAGDNIKFYVVVTHQWNEYSESTLPQSYTPDSDVDNAQSHTPVVWTANYTIQ